MILDASLIKKKTSTSFRRSPLEIRGRTPSSPGWSSRKSEVFLQFSSSNITAHTPFEILDNIIRKKCLCFVPIFYHLCDVTLLWSHVVVSVSLEANERPLLTKAPSFPLGAIGEADSRLSRQQKVIKGVDIAGGWAMIDWRPGIYWWVGQIRNWMRKGCCVKFDVKL